MTKAYCDFCGRQTTNGDAQRIKGKMEAFGKPTVQFEILVGVNGVWNGGDVCHACIRKAVKESGLTRLPS